MLQIPLMVVGHVIYEKVLQLEVIGQFHGSVTPVQVLPDRVRPHSVS
jgi:hypothetical protein